LGAGEINDKEEKINKLTKNEKKREKCDNIGFIKK
jgi:hypothetical protein